MRKTKVNELDNKQIKMVSKKDKNGNLIMQSSRWLQNFMYSKATIGDKFRFVKPYVLGEVTDSKGNFITESYGEGMGLKIAYKITEEDYAWKLPRGSVLRIKEITDRYIDFIFKKKLVITLSCFDNPKDNMVIASEAFNRE